MGNFLKKNYQSLSKKYRATGKGSLEQEEVAAYLVGRMPATRAAIRKVFEEISLQLRFSVGSILDLGSGPGSGFLAASEVFGNLNGVMVESNPHMISAGKKLVSLPKSSLQFFHEDLLQFKPEGEVDLALFGYSYGELDPQRRLDLLSRVFAKSQVVVVIEPGTVQGYKNVVQARDFLLGEGGQMVAPCPHERACPMLEGDWCHFSVRVSRSKEHRRIKGAELGYEDEKFSYVSISKTRAMPVGGRILRHPFKQKGRVSLKICGQEGIFETMVSKKMGERYRSARRAKWGDGLERPIGAE